MNIKVGDRVRVRVGVGVGVATVANVAEDLVDFRMQRSGKVVRRHKRNVVEVLPRNDHDDHEPPPEAATANLPEPEHPPSPEPSAAAACA